MKGEYVNIYLHDEYPLVGSGNRRFIAWEGRKWVYLYYWPKAMTVRVTPKKYAELKPRKLPAYDVNRDTARAYIEGHIASERGSVASAKQALTILSRDECVLPIHEAPALAPIGVPSGVKVSHPRRKARNAGGQPIKQKRKTRTTRRRKAA